MPPLFCELCGKPIRDKAFRVAVDRAEIILCPSCARKHGKIVGEYRSPSSRANTGLRRVKKQLPAVSRRMRMPRLREEELEVVEDYADIVRKAREEMGLTRGVLARMIGEKESTIKRIEDGRLIPSINLARKLEKILKIKLLQPVGEEEVEFTGEEAYITFGDIVEFRD